MSDAFGWIGQMLLMLCSIPQAYMSWKNGHSKGLSASMIWFWGFGMFFSLFYFIAENKIPAIVNYCFTLLVWAVIAWYHVFPRKGISP